MKYRDRVPGRVTQSARLPCTPAEPARVSAAARPSSGPEAIRKQGPERSKSVLLSPRSDSESCQALSFFVAADSSAALSPGVSRERLPRIAKAASVVPGPGSSQVETRGSI